jgi:hypothetical protein
MSIQYLITYNMYKHRFLKSINKSPILFIISNSHNNLISQKAKIKDMYLVIDPSLLLYL